ncbi:hypothetical protein [Thermococcus thioreducens]|uniref:Uncharacterized protein n=1 Tax=Thermococcus thioreducens TaxID=277988 RepID=A0A0Q2UMI7_9EURY|nr:hypothetical protein [Thermococcus thioreducens]ASJ11508.1 hypothetical protein A3L14_00770 [Thermococcus thioreducens]KQH81880.1 hypothetical protein AMR53_09055 [Thermococcus thioreducens]SEW05431.1 hypothetical protein SAMN05216170_1280 [Thermococcus thioreducens]
MIREILAFVFLIAFLFINLVLMLMRTFGSLAGMTWRKVLRLEIPENKKKGLEKLYTLFWLTVGIWAFWKLWGTSGAAAIFGFLAFRSGANITKTLIYGLHDQRIIEKYTEDSRLLGIIGTATKLTIMLETVFVVAFALAYKAFSVTLSPGGVSANTFILSLWVLGLIFGLLFGRFIARNNDGILLQNAVAVVGFFTTRKGKKKTEETVEKAKKAPRKLRSKFPKLEK